MSPQNDGGGNTPEREIRQVKPRWEQAEQAGRGMHVTRLNGHVAAEIELSAVLCAAPACSFVVQEAWNEGEGMWRKGFRCVLAAFGAWTPRTSREFSALMCGQATG